MTKANMIKHIITQAKACGVNVDGDMFFSLAFRSESELIKIGKKMGVDLEVGE